MRSGSDPSAAEIGKARRFAGALMLASGVTHLSELWVFGFGSPVMAVVVGFGIAFFLIGFHLLRPGRRVLWWGATLPALAAFLGIANSIRMGSLHPYTVRHLTVFPICVWLLRDRRREARAA
jgi:hypothetical protein